MRIETLLNAVGLVDESLKNKIGNGNSWLSRYSFACSRVTIIDSVKYPAGAGQKTALAAAVIQQGKAFRAHRQATAH